MADKSVFTRLKRLFSTDVIIRNVGGNQLKIIDTNSETNSETNLDNNNNSEKEILPKYITRHIHKKTNREYLIYDRKIGDKKSDRENLTYTMKPGNYEDNLKIFRDKIEY